MTKKTEVCGGIHGCGEVVYRNDDSSCPNCGHRSVNPPRGEYVAKTITGHFISLPEPGTAANRCVWTVTLEGDVQEDLVYFSEIDSWLLANRADPIVIVGKLPLGDSLGVDDEWKAWKRETAQMTSELKVEPLLETGVLDEIEAELSELDDDPEKDENRVAIVAVNAFERYAERYPEREKGEKIQERVLSWLVEVLQDIERIPNDPNESFLDAVIDRALGDNGASVVTYGHAELTLGGKKIPITNLSISMGKKGKKT